MMKTSIPLTANDSILSRMSYHEMEASKKSRARSKDESTAVRLLRARLFSNLHGFDGVGVRHCLPVFLRSCSAASGPQLPAA
jgi:hypothetical protein